MNEKNEHQRLFTRRALILGGAQGVLLTSLIGRMYYLQILSNEHYRLLSDKNRIYSRLIAPSRGQIVDRVGVLLATNQSSYRAVIIQEQVEDLSKTLVGLRKILDLSSEKIDHVLEEIKRKPRFIPVTVKDFLTWEEVAKVQLKLPDFPGVIVEEGQERFYPHALATCHTVGYVASVSEEDLDEDPLLELPGFRIGKNGIEKVFDQQLQGRAGVQQVEVTARRRIVRTLSTHESISGVDVQVSMDLQLQETVMTILSQYKAAAAAVLEVNTGEVLACASYPGFNANSFVQGISKNDWTQLIQDPYKAFNNKVIAGQYSPGSTFKMIVALAALEAKVINSTTQFFCGGHTQLGNHRFHCWKKEGHGSINLSVAIPQSCDIFFFEIARLLGIDLIAAMARRFGLGEKSGIELTGEKSGLVPNRSWKSMVMGKSWNLGETFNASIGQGYVLSTILQLAMMTARLCNGGKSVYPRLVKSDTVAEFEDMDLNQDHLQLVLEGMNRTINDPIGVAYSARITEPGFEMAGKTGTTQVKSITRRERELDLHKDPNRPWEVRDHALFVGFAPVVSPRFAVATIVEHGESGRRVATPLGRDILLATQHRMSKL